ncbi:hypothetical protein A8C32_05725 [Flavivirga aquatica]|uniref:DUF2147 domain-containing protein n=1 Tax=Flavivirga aquatica TaxID=1849968 RepID=A0A1E5SHZ9_9FLAO|nr:DUF2147 domain-containing protein [Flavivirga aquatica]OEJ98696.1 hypothetical protein A8C32_05725 [Flavivirga aquatica]
MRASLCCGILCLMSFSMFSQDILGKWKTIDNETNKEKSIIEIYEKDGKVFGKIIEILNPKKKEALCRKCEGDEKDKPVLGLVLIKNMEKDGDYYNNGTIFNPENGKKYNCRLKLEEKNVLQVRGYISFLYATQYWKRIVD